MKSSGMSFLSLGIIFFAIGISKGGAFRVLGIVFLAIGISALVRDRNSKKNDPS
jgi:hypothetical protein